MSIGIGDNLGKSFGFAKDSLVGKWLNWLLLIIVAILPPVQFILGTGIYAKILRGEKLEVNNIVKAIIDGLLILVIAVIYSIPAMIVGGLLNLIGLGVLSIIVEFIALLIFIPALVNFSKKGFGAAFAFGDIIAKIGKVGWVDHIVSSLVIVIILAICCIPVIGWIITPFGWTVAFKMAANLLA